MPLKIAIQMDPLTAINPLGDSTILLAYEACRLGHTLYHYTPDAMTYGSPGGLTAMARPFAIQSLETEWKYTLGESVRLDLSGMDVILLRQDPPFDMTYLTTTFMLEMLSHKPGKKPLIVNDPVHVRNHPEKWFPLAYPEFVPPTLISRDLEALKAFRKEQGEIVLKPLYGFGGRSVFHVGREDKNFYSFLEMFFEQSNEPIIAQRFIPDVREKEMRVVIIDDYVAPVLNRVPPEEEIRSNLRVGGVGRKIELTPKQKSIVERLVPDLQKRGLLLVGLDLIGDYVTEINITSPTGLRAINKLYGVKLETIFWEKISARLAARH